MISALSKICVTIFLGLLFNIAVLPVFAASNFMRVPLGKGASIEVPKNWIALSGNSRTTLDAYVESKGYRQTEADLTFAATLYDEHKKTIAMVNARFYPDNPMTQAMTRPLTVAELKQLDAELRQSTEVSLKATGMRMLNWRGSKIQVIKGLHVFVHENRNSGRGDSGAVIVRALRVWNSPRSFTVTLAYREKDSKLVLPIVDYMTQSLRQE
jgi:hypothetical protein